MKYLLQEKKNRIILIQNEMKSQKNKSARVSTWIQERNITDTKEDLKLNNSSLLSKKLKI
jgi:hypothetical protein